MSSSIAVKNAQHREIMESLDVKHKERMQRLREKQRKELTDSKEKHTINKKRQSLNQRNQLQSMENDHLFQQDKERLKHQQRLDQQKLEAQKEYHRAAIKRQEQNARLKQTALLEKQKYAETRDHYAKLREKRKHLGEADLRRMEQTDKFRMRQQKSKNKEQMDSVRRGHNKEMARMDQANQQFLRERKETFARKENTQKTAHQDQLKQNQNHFEGVKNRQHDYYHDKLDKDEQFFQDQIETQRKEYTKRYQENERMNKSSFENQKNRYEEELFSVRKDFVSTKKFYDDRKLDPFYQLVDFGAQFSEGEAFYEIVATIPEHEMKNVRVRVQPEKISLHATRMHEQEFKRENEKIASNNAQTVRQEFSLDKPVDHEKAVQTYENGRLIVTVPKKGYYKFGIGE